ncbi:MAG: hypothetical protein ABJP22_01755 [Hyphomicrobiales bacterium]
MAVVLDMAIGSVVSVEAERRPSVQDTSMLFHDVTWPSAVGVELIIRSKGDRFVDGARRSQYGSCAR